MQCQTCRDAVSAQLDHEDPGVPDHLVDLHLTTCARCRAFAADAQILRRRVAVRPADPVPDLTEAILAAAPPAAVPVARSVPAVSSDDRASRSGHWSRWALLGAALTQLALALPPLVLGEESGASVHVAREVGAWGLALGAAWLVAAFRPSRAAGLLPFALTLVAVIGFGAAVDVASGAMPLVEETHHLLTLVGVGLLARVARLHDDDGPLMAGFGARPTLAA